MAKKPCECLPGQRSGDPMATANPLQTTRDVESAPSTTKAAPAAGKQAQRAVLGSALSFFSVQCALSLASIPLEWARATQRTGPILSMITKFDAYVGLRGAAICSGVYSNLVDNDAAFEDYCDPKVQQPRWLNLAQHFKKWDKLEDGYFGVDRPAQVDFALSVVVIGAVTSFAMMVLLGGCKNKCMKVIGMLLGAGGAVMGVIELSASLAFRSYFPGWELVENWSDDDSDFRALKSCTYGCILAAIAGASGIIGGLSSVAAFARSM